MWTMILLRTTNRRRPNLVLRRSGSFSVGTIEKSDLTRKQRKRYSKQLWTCKLYSLVCARSFGTKFAYASFWFDLNLPRVPSATSGMRWGTRRCTLSLTIKDETISGTCYGKRAFCGARSWFGVAWLSRLQRTRGTNGTRWWKSSGLLFYTSLLAFVHF